MKYIIESKHHSTDKWNRVTCGSFNTIEEAEKELQKEDYTMFDLDTYKDATDYWDKELYLFPIDEYHFRIKELI